MSADRADWQHLFVGYNAFYGRTMPDEFFDRSWAEFRAAQRMYALGASLGGTLVGIAHFLPHASTTSADSCYLQDLFTAPQARGRGVARALITAVTDWARAHRCAASIGRRRSRMPPLDVFMIRSPRTAASSSTRFRSRRRQDGAGPVAQCCRQVSVQRRANSVVSVSIRSSTAGSGGGWRNPSDEGPRTTVPNDQLAGRGQGVVAVTADERRRNLR
jgi:GNAT superfamily N-acetyltransferase